MKFSVLISLYAKERPDYLNQALKSVWNDQNVKPNEIVLVKDGPLTSSLEKVLEDFSKTCNVLNILSLNNNMGLSKALNIGLSHCEFDYVARMDTDDICRSDRFEKQLLFFENNPEVDIVGSFTKKIDEAGKELDSIKVPISNNDIKKLIWTCPFIHPSVMFKKKKILSVGSYNPNSGPRQDDFELWFRCAAAELKFANIPENLLYYRFFADNIKKNNLKVGWYRFKVGYKGCRKLNLGLIAYIGIIVPLVRALLPYPLNMYFYKILDKINPRNK